MTTSTIPKKKCPYCGQTYQAKGLHTHVLRTADEDHGGSNNVPDDLNKEDIETVNKAPMNSMTKSSSRSSENHLYLCHYCNELFKGERGLKIHLETAGRSPMHPDDVTIENEEYTLIPADEDYNPFMDTEEIYEITKRRRRRNEILDDF